MNEKQDEYNLELSVYEQKIKAYKLQKLRKVSRFFYILKDSSQNILWIELVSLLFTFHKDKYLIIWAFLNCKRPFFYILFFR